MQLDLVKTVRFAKEATVIGAQVIENGEENTKILSCGSISKLTSTANTIAAFTCVNPGTEKPAARIR